MQGRIRPVVVILITRDSESMKRGMFRINQSMILISFLY